MVRFFCSGLPRWQRGGGRSLLALVWLSGLLCGTAAYFSTGGQLISLMRSALYAPVSIVGMLCVTTLPFLLSAFAVFLSRPVWLLPICFGKAFLYAFFSVAVCSAFWPAGWLLRWLLLFGDCAGGPILYWFWLRHLSPDCSMDGGGCILLCALGLLLGSVNYSIILPFLASLIEI